MSSTESPVSVTFCVGKPAMVTLRADTPALWLVVARQAVEEGMLAEVRQVNDELNGVRPAAQPAARTAKPAKPAEAAKPDGQDQQLPESMGVRCETCGGPTQPHPTKHEGNSPQSGKPYRRYVCTANNLHRNTFINA